MSNHIRNIPLRQTSLSHDVLHNWVDRERGQNFTNLLQCIPDILRFQRLTFVELDCIPCYDDDSIDATLTSVMLQVQLRWLNEHDRLTTSSTVFSNTYLEAEDRSDCPREEIEQYNYSCLKVNLRQIDIFSGFSVTSRATRGNTMSLERIREE